jgi:hypothetical protein
MKSISTLIIIINSIIFVLSSIKLIMVIKEYKQFKQEQ